MLLYNQARFLQINLHKVKFKQLLYKSFNSLIYPPVSSNDTMLNINYNFTYYEYVFCLHPLKKPPSLNSLSPNSSGPMPTRDTPLALRSGSSLLISDAIHRQIWQPNLRRKKRTTGWFCHRDMSSTFCNNRGNHAYQFIKPTMNWKTEIL